MTGNKREKAIVMGATGNMAFAVANVLMGVKKHSPQLNADYIIFHNDFTNEDKSLINRIVPCNFIEYKFPIKEEYRFTEHYFNRFTKMAFSIFECFNLLDNYEKVLWLDIDLLIQKDISDIFNHSESGWAMAKENCNLAGNFYETPDFIQENDQPKSYNTGVVLFSDNLPNYEKMAERCYELTYQYAKHLLLSDQSTINLLIHLDNLNITELPKAEYNCLPNEPGVDVSDAAIVHAHGDYKFWNYYKFEEWNQNYKEWIKRGGSAYNGKRISGLNKFYRDYLSHIPNPARQPKKFVQYFLAMGN